MNSLSRREFIEKMALRSAALSVPLITGGAASGCTTAGTSQKIIGALGNRGLRRLGIPEGRTPMEPVVSEIRSQIARIGSGNAVTSAGKIDPAIVHTMIREGIKSLGGTSHPEDGWARVFPSYKKGQTVGILINVSQELRTQSEVVIGLVKELVALGIEPTDIIVWGNVQYAKWERMGYHSLMADLGVTLRTNHDTEAGFDRESLAEIPSADLELPLSRILTTQCDHLINVPVLKSHDLCGVTGALKLYYAAIPLADALLRRGEGVPSRSEIRRIVKKVHARNGNPQIAELAANPLVQKKTRLYVGDALLSRYEGGPFGAAQWINGQLLITQDPVALDYQGFQLIDKMRHDKGLESAALWVKYIQTAAEIGLGTNHPGQMEIMDIAI